MERPSLCSKYHSSCILSTTHHRESSAMGKFGPLASLLGQIRQIFLLCVISSPLFSPDSHRRGSVQSKLCYGPGGCPRHVAISTAALGFIIHNTGRRYRISLIYVKMHTNRGRFQVSKLSTNYQIKSIRMQLRGEKIHFNGIYTTFNSRTALSPPFSSSKL